MEEAVVTAVTHDTSEAKVTVSGVPDRPGVAARLFRALADKSINVDMIVQNTSAHGTTDISFTVPTADLAVAVETSQAHADELGASGVTADADGGPGLARRGRHEVAPGHRGHHVRDAGRREDQHRHDLHLDDPDLVHRAPRPTSSGPCAACTRRSPWADAGPREGLAHAVAAPARQGGHRPAPGRLGLRPRADPPGPPRRRGTRPALRRARRGSGPPSTVSRSRRWHWCHRRPARRRRPSWSWRTWRRRRRSASSTSSTAPTPRRCSPSWARLPDDVVSAVVVGHNPTAHALSQALLSPHDKKGHSLAVRHGFPTCALGVYALKADRWADVATGTAKLVAILVPPYGGVGSTRSGGPHRVLNSTFGRGQRDGQDH